MATFANSYLGELFDWRLHQLLADGPDIYEDDRPPVESTGPNHKGATEHFCPLDAIMTDDVDHGWISGGSERLKNWQAHISPVSCVPKPGTDKFRTVGDYGHPRDGKTASALGTYSVPPNPNCRIGPEFFQVWSNPQQIERSSASTPRP